MSALAPTLQAFFTDRLVRQRNASPNTIAAYRDTLKLLLGFASNAWAASQRAGHRRARRTIIAAFLNHLEHDRGNSIATRNARLAAIHSLFRYAAHRHPEHAQDIQRVLAIPIKRSDRALVTFLEPDEINALIKAPDRATWTGRRDHALLVTAIQTGLRATELTGLNIADVHLGTGAHVNARERTQRGITPLTKITTAILRVWIAERGGRSNDPLFPTSQGRRSPATASSADSPNTWRPQPSRARR